MRKLYSLSTLAVMAIALSASTARAGENWCQWGGEGQNFVSDSKGLAENWPKDGPPKLWSRDLGEGYSAIITDGQRLYTMYRKDGKENVIALDPKTGSTIWETGYEISPKDGHVARFGQGPRSTPEVKDGRVYAIGVRGTLTCMNADDGKLLWKHELWDDYDGTFLNHGYSSSPYIYKDSVIAFVGGEGHSIYSFDKKTGDLNWKKHDFGNSYCSPKLINVDGQDQLACFMGGEIVGIDPNNGDLLWSFAHENDYRQNCTLPIWTNDNILVITSLSPGTQALKLTRNGDSTKVEEAWSTRKMRLHHSNAVQVGDYIYSVSGGNVKFLMAVNVKDGDLAFRERGFAKANLLFADGKFIILDEDGNLMLAEPEGEKVKIIAKVPMTEKVSWTVPTLVGNTLFVRDQKSIMALDVGKDIG